nr:lipocalin family protein [uncultured Flavobacterium sp.]
MKNLIKIFLLLIIPILATSCEDEDDNRDITKTLILGNWIPFEAQQGRNNIYTWDQTCGNDYLLIADETSGEFSLHFQNCTIFNNNPFTYRLENGFLYILENGQTQEYRRQIVKLTATELTLSDPDHWQDNYIKYTK